MKGLNSYYVSYNNLYFACMIMEEAIRMVIQQLIDGRASPRLE